MPKTTSSSPANSSTNAISKELELVQVTEKLGTLIGIEENLNNKSTNTISQGQINRITQAGTSNVNVQRTLPNSEKTSIPSTKSVGTSTSDLNITKPQNVGSINEKQKHYLVGKPQVNSKLKESKPTYGKPKPRRIETQTNINKYSFQQTVKEFNELMAGILTIVDEIEQVSSNEMQAHYLRNFNDIVSKSLNLVAGVISDLSDGDSNFTNSIYTDARLSNSSNEAYERTKACENKEINTIETNKFPKSYQETKYNYSMRSPAFMYEQFTEDGTNVHCKFPVFGDMNTTQYAEMQVVEFLRTIILGSVDVLHCETLFSIYKQSELYRRFADSSLISICSEPRFMDVLKNNLEAFIIDNDGYVHMRYGNEPGCLSRNLASGTFIRGKQSASVARQYRVTEMHKLSVVLVIRILKIKPMSPSKLMDKLINNYTSVATFLEMFSHADFFKFLQIHPMYFRSDVDGIIYLKDCDIPPGGVLKSRIHLLNVVSRLEDEAVNFYIKLLKNEKKLNLLKLECSLHSAPGYVVSYFEANYPEEEFSNFFIDHVTVFKLQGDNVSLVLSKVEPVEFSESSSSIDDLPLARTASAISDDKNHSFRQSD